MRVDKKGDGFFPWQSSLGLSHKFGWLSFSAVARGSFGHLRQTFSSPPAAPQVSFSSPRHRERVRKRQIFDHRPTGEGEEEWHVLLFQLGASLKEELWERQTPASQPAPLFPASRVIFPLLRLPPTADSWTGKSRGRRYRFPSIYEGASGE